MQLVTDLKPGQLWENKSPSSPIYERLANRLIPPSGMAATTRGEALRALSAIYHDVYNNGGSNFSMPYFEGHRRVLEAFIEEHKHLIDLERHEAVCSSMKGVDEGIETYLYELDETVHDILADAEFLLALEQMAEFVIYLAWLLDRKSVKLEEEPGS